jgi:hypothetical protein
MSYFVTQVHINPRYKFSPIAKTQVKFFRCNLIRLPFSFNLHGKRRSARAPLLRHGIVGHPKGGPDQLRVEVNRRSPEELERGFVRDDRGPLAREDKILLDIQFARGLELERVLNEADGKLEQDERKHPS